MNKLIVLQDNLCWLDGFFLKVLCLPNIISLYTCVYFIFVFKSTIKPFNVKRIGKSFYQNTSFSGFINQYNTYYTDIMYICIVLGMGQCGVSILARPLGYFRLLFHGTIEFEDNNGRLNMKMIVYYRWIFLFLINNIRIVQLDHEMFCAWH